MQKFQHLLRLRVHFKFICRPSVTIKTYDRYWKVWTFFYFHCWRHLPSSCGNKKLLNKRPFTVTPLTLSDASEVSWFFKQKMPKWRLQLNLRTWVKAAIWRRHAHLQVCFLQMNPFWKQFDFWKLPNKYWNELDCFLPKMWIPNVCLADFHIPAFISPRYLNIELTSTERFSKYWMRQN